MVDAVEGRTDEMLPLPGETGDHVQVHPVVFHQTLDLIDAAGWQVQQETDGLRILVAFPGPHFQKAATETAVQATLTAAGTATPQVTVTVVDAIPVGAAGKRPLVIAQPAGTGASRGETHH